VRRQRERAPITSTRTNEDGDRMIPRPSGSIAGKELILTRSFRAPIEDGGLRTLSRQLVKARG
jgi:hypothetical protein